MSGQLDRPLVAGSTDSENHAAVIPKRFIPGRALVEFLGDGKVHHDLEICESLIQRFDRQGSDKHYQILPAGLATL